MDDLTLNGAHSLVVRTDIVQKAISDAKGGS